MSISRPPLARPSSPPMGHARATLERVGLGDGVAAVRIGPRRILGKGVSLVVRSPIDGSTLTRFPAAEALARFSKVLRRYAASLGKADRYHETITWAYLLLLNERIRRGPHRDVGTICRHVRRPVRLEELDPAEVLSPGNVALRAGAPGLPHARSILNVPSEGILS